MLSFLFGILLFCLGLLGPFLYQPIVGIGVYAALVHITPQQLNAEFLRIPIVTAVSTLISYIFCSLYPNKFNVLPAEIGLFLVILLGMFLGAFNAYDSALAFEHFYVYLKYSIFLLLLVNIVNTPKRLEIFYNFIILSAAWMVYKCWDLRGTTGARFENFGGGVVGDSNHFAAALIMLMPLVIVRCFRDTNIFYRIGAVLGVFGMTMSVLITVSRGGFLGLLTIFTCFIFILKKNKVRILISLCILFISILPFLPQNYIDRMTSIRQVKLGIVDNSMQGRLDAWETAIEVWKEFPIYGCGLRNFIYYNGYLNEGLPWGYPGHVAHSIWFEALAEGGLMVFLPLTGLIVLFFYRTSRSKNKFISNKDIYADIIAIKIGMIGFLVCASFLNRLIYEPIYWWFCIGYIYDKILIPGNDKYGTK